MATKGNNTAETPHRQSFIEETPEKILSVKAEQLSALTTAIHPKHNRRKPGDSAILSGFDLESYLKKNGISYQYKSGPEYDLFVLDVCVWDSSHDNKAAFLMRFQNGHIIARCHHDSCQGKGFDDFLKAVGDPDYPALEDLLLVSSKKTSGKKEPQIISLVNAVKSRDAECFFDQAGDGYLNIEFNGICENFRIRSDSTRNLLYLIYDQDCSEILSPSTVNQAKEYFEAKAFGSNAVRHLDYRINSTAKAIVYDLGDKMNYVKISKGQVKLTKRASLSRLFIRKPNLKAQQQPDLNADATKLLDLLQRHMRVKSEHDLLLLGVYIVAAMIPYIALPILFLSGAKGASKSTVATEIKSIVDPSQSPLSALSRNPMDLPTTLANSYMLCFDNLSSLSDEMSNCFCMAVTGGGLPKRKLYTDNEEVVIHLKRKIIMTGIFPVPSQSDLLDRSIIVELDRIPDDQRMGEQEVLRRFQQDIPSILGACFDALSKALKSVDTLQLNKLPRMADFANYGYAIAEALGVSGQKFLDAYKLNIDLSSHVAIEANALAQAIDEFTRMNNHWQGKAAKLLDLLQKMAIEKRIDQSSPTFPKSASHLSRDIKVIKHDLEVLGISMEIVPVSGGYKEIKLDRA